MRPCAAVLLLVATVAGLSLGSRTDRVAPFRETRDVHGDWTAALAGLGQVFASDVATLLEEAGLDPAVPITEVCPKALWSAVHAVGIALVKHDINPDCFSAFFIQHLMGFVRYVTPVVLEKDLMQTVKTCGQSVTDAPEICGTLPSIPLTESIHAAILSNLEEKIGAIAAMMGDFHIEVQYSGINALIDAAVVKHQPVGQVMTTVIMGAFEKLPAFPTAVDCHVADKMDAGFAMIHGIIEYLDAGYVHTVLATPVSGTVKQKILGQLAPVMSTMASTVDNLITAHKKGVTQVLAAYFKTCGGQPCADGVLKKANIARIIHQIMANGKMEVFAEALEKGNTKDELTAFIRMVALSLGDLDPPTEKIKGILMAIHGDITGGTSRVSRVEAALEYLFNFL